MEITLILDQQSQKLLSDFEKVPDNKKSFVANFVADQASTEINVSDTNFVNRLNSHVYLNKQLAFAAAVNLTLEQWLSLTEDEQMELFEVDLND